MADKWRTPPDPFERPIEHDPPLSPYPHGHRKLKWISGLLAFIFPGLGHFYLGMMQRGLFFMLLFIGVIVGIVFFAIEGIVPLIVLMSVLVPVVFFYSFFDALQSTERENAGFAYPYTAGQSYKRSIGGKSIGWLLVGIGILVFLVTSKPAWFETLTDESGSLIVAILMIGAGVTIFLKNR